MRTFRHFGFIWALFPGIMFTACRKEASNAHFSVEFTHSVGNKVFIKDSLYYINAAGNPYEVNELQYFISDIILHASDGKDVAIIADRGVHYLDIDIPASLRWNFDQVIPAGNYDSVSFTFGINKEQNKTGFFVNPPERDMFWPDMMGGGYHYLKMNGRWADQQNQLNPFNFHLGIGMVDDGMGMRTFIQNYFKVKIPNSAVNLTSGTIHLLTVNMDIARWFETPNLWNWNVIGGMIMNNQAAMHMVHENGGDVFSCTWRNKK